MNNRILSLLFAAVAFVFPAHANIVYVDIAAAGANNGSSWIDGFTDLQAGIAATIPGDTIWVAQGVYKPTTTTTRSISFVLPDGVKIFGGFNGTETLLAQRNFNTYLSILSGDIGVTGNANDNTYNVVKTTSVSSATRLDGFRIISGNGTGGPGGGLFNATGSPVIANCILEFNRADNGAALSQFNGGSMTVLNCTFRNNTANDNGGAIEVRAGTMTLADCNIHSNTAGLDGGALYLYGGITRVDRTSISGNTAAFLGGAIHGYYFSTLTLTNSLLAGNIANDASAIYFPPLSNTNAHLLLNCTIADNSGSTTGNSCCVTLNSNSEISNCIFRGNQDPVEIYGLTGAVNYSIVEGGFTGAGANQILNVNPNFVSPGNYLLAPFDAAAYDYHVGVLSPATNAGDNSYLVPIYNFDLENNPRVHGPLVDLGCYENPYCTFNLWINSSGSDSICQGSNTMLTASGGTTFLWSDFSTGSSITVNSAGTYDLLADSSGCLGSASIQIVVLPASVSIAGNANLCNGDSTLLTASGSNLVSYLWNTSAASSSIYVYTAGSYSVTATAANGCTATDMFTVTLAPDPAPVITYSNGILYTADFTTHQWLFNNGTIPGATDSQYVPTQNGSYSVIVTNSFGCTDTAVVYIVTDVSISEYMTPLFSVFPNPCAATLHLEFTSASESTVVQVTDVLGQEVRCVYPSGATQLNMDVSGLPAGIYFVTVRNNSASSTIRVIKD